MTDTTSTMIVVGCCCSSYLFAVILGIIIGRGSKARGYLNSQPIGAGKLRRQGRLAVSDE